MYIYTKRASTACTWCHEKKVRCDANKLGQPCTRCRQDNRECVMRPKMRSSADSRVSQKEDVSESPALGMGDCERQWIPAFDHPAMSDTTPNDIALGQTSFSSYSFIRLDTSRYDTDDIAFLNSKGCLSIPSPLLLEQFVRQYFLHIQPCTPIIDESVFWNMFRQSFSGEPDLEIPLLLFQAMLFACSPYISLETAQQCGFDDRRHAWNSFYQRAKTLFNLPDESDPLTRAQAALLLSLHTSPGEPQEASLWLTTSIHSAKLAHSRMNNIQIPEEIKASQLILDRLWWSILLRDRSLSIGLRRRSRFTSRELQMMSDLPTEYSFQNEIQGSRVYDSETKRLLVTVLREQCQLAMLLTGMVSITFDSDIISFTSFTKEAFQSTMSDLSRIRTSIQLWKNSSPLSQMEKMDIYPAVVRFTKLTLMYYEAAQMELAHYEALIVERYHPYVAFDYVRQMSHIGNILQHAASRLIIILKYFSNQGKHQNLPLTIVAYTAMPLILSAINFKLSETGDEMDARRRPLQYLSELMKLSTYDVADEIILRTDDILHLANRISQQVFLQNESNLVRSKSIQYSRKGSISSLSDSSRAVTGKYRVKNWHQAFLQHTRAYLLISLSVDYFMSVGQLPRNSDLPELVCFMPPFGEIRLPWSISQGFPSANSAEGERRRRAREIQRIREVSEEESSVRFLEAEEARSDTSTIETVPLGGTEGHGLNDIIPDPTQGDFAMNINYFDLGQSLQPFHTSSFEDESTSLPLSLDGNGMAGNQYWQDSLNNLAGITPFKDGELSHLVDDCLTSKFLNS